MKALPMDPRLHLAVASMLFVAGCTSGPSTSGLVSALDQRFGPEVDFGGSSLERCQELPEPVGGRRVTECKATLRMRAPSGLQPKEPATSPEAIRQAALQQMGQARLIGLLHEEGQRRLEAGETVEREAYVAFAETADGWTLAKGPSATLLDFNQVKSRDRGPSRR